MRPNRYRKKPVEISAVRWNGTPEHAQEIIQWVLSLGFVAWYNSIDYGYLRVENPNRTTYTAMAYTETAPEKYEEMGDWIVFDGDRVFTVTDRKFYDRFEQVS